MKLQLTKSAVVLALAVAVFTLGACSTMPDSHRTSMQTHEMGSTSKPQTMSNDAMPDRSSR